MQKTALSLPIEQVAPRRRTGEQQWPFPALLPVLLLLLVSFAVPLAAMVRMSFNTKASGQDIVEAFSLVNYATILSDNFYYEVFGTTFGVAIGVTFFCLVFGFPLAVAYSHTRGTRKALLATIILGPLLINVVVRTYGWLILLSNRGLVNEFLHGLGLIQDPIKFLYNPFGVGIALVHVFLPFMVLSISAALQTMEPSLAEAAETLGADKPTVFRRVTLPLAMPGVVAGCILVFSGTLGAFASPLVLGGTSLRMLVVVIYTNALILFNWPRSAALAVVLLVLVLFLLWLQERWRAGRAAEGGAQ